MFKLSLKQFIYDKLNIILLFTVTLGQLFYANKNIKYFVDAYKFYRIEIFRNTLRTGKLSFIVFLIISYRFIIKNNRTGIKEIIKTTPMNESGNTKIHLFTLICINGIYTCFLWICNIISAIYLDCAYFEYIFFMLKAFILYIFLFALVGIVIGSFLAYCKSEYRAYTLMILVILLFCSEFSNTFFKAFSNNEKEFTYQLAELMQIYARSTRMIPDFEYIIATEGVNWWKTFFWIFLFLYFLFWAIQNNKKRIIVSGFFLPILAICLIMYNQPASTFYAFELFDRYDNLDDARNYYSVNDSYTNMKVQNIDHFKINSINLYIKPGRELDVKAEIEINESTLTAYYFTLAHNYVIKSITDCSGNPLKYDRISDYLIIYNDNGNLNKIIISYHGSNGVHLANNTIVGLTPNFPWYPHSGIQQVYDTDRGMYCTGISEDKISFYVKIVSSNKIYSNLSNINCNEFGGYSEGCLLFSGLCIDELVIDENRIIYPLLRYESDEIIEKYNEILQLYNDKGYHLEKMDWYIIPQFGIEDGSVVFFMEDCFAGSYDGLIARLKTKEFYGELPETIK